jgi:transcriptional regulator with XRE-family HTH domain
MKDQLLRIMENEQMTPAKFADEIGVQRSSISHILSGRNKPSYDFILKILQRFQGINADWLITGKGSMIKLSGQTIVANTKEPSLFDQSVNVEEKVRLNQEKNIVEKQKSQDQYNKVKEGTFSERLENFNINTDNLKKITNVNDVKIVVMFFEDGTFKQYLSR